MSNGWFNALGDLNKKLGEASAHSCYLKLWKWIKFHLGKEGKGGARENPYETPTGDTGGERNKNKGGEEGQPVRSEAIQESVKSWSGCSKEQVVGWVKWCNGAPGKWYDSIEKPRIFRVRELSPIAY